MDAIPSQINYIKPHNQLVSGSLVTVLSHCPPHLLSPLKKKFKATALHNIHAYVIYVSMHKPLINKYRTGDFSRERNSANVIYSFIYIYVILFGKNSSVPFVNFNNFMLL